MPLDLFEQIVSILKSILPQPLPLVSFAAYNEPTADPFFVDRLRVLTNHGFTYWWLSNGSGFSEALIDFLVTEKPRTSNFMINTFSSDAGELSESVGISVRAAEVHLNQLQEAMRALKGHKKFVVKMHGTGDENQKHRIDAMKRWVPHSEVQVLGAGLMDRAGSLPGVGNPYHRNSLLPLLCGASYLKNLYIGVGGEAYLCCHDYYKKTQYGSVLDPAFTWPPRFSARSASLKVLQSEFCSRCEFAISVTDEPLRAARHLIQPLRRSMPRSLETLLRQAYRLLQR